MVMTRQSAIVSSTDLGAILYHVIASCQDSQRCLISLIFRVNYKFYLSPLHFLKAPLPHTAFISNLFSSLTR